VVVVAVVGVVEDDDVRDVLGVVMVGMVDGTGVDEGDTVIGLKKFESMNNKLLRSRKDGTYSVLVDVESVAPVSVVADTSVEVVVTSGVVVVMLEVGRETGPGGEMGIGLSVVVVEGL
jgi:hypothetical protein